MYLQEMILSFSGSLSVLVLPGTNIQNKNSLQYALPEITPHSILKLNSQYFLTFQIFSYWVVSLYLSSTPLNVLFVILPQFVITECTLYLEFSDLQCTLHLHSL